MAAPWLIGLLFLLWTTLTSFLLVQLFRIRSAWGQILTSGLVCTNLSLKKELDHQATLTLASRMIDRVELLEGYVPGETPVAFVGRLDHNTYLNHGRKAFSNIQQTAGLWDDYGATYNMGRYLTDYLNYPLVWDTETDFSHRTEVEDMPVFPAADSIAMVDGTVVPMRMWSEWRERQSGPSGPC